MLSNLTVASRVASHHLAVSLSLYNPSNCIDIYYDTVDAELCKGGDVVVISQADPSATSLAKFLQERKIGNVVELEFEGRGLGGPVGLEEVKGDEAPMAVGMELDVHMRVRYVFAVINIQKKPRIQCWINIPVRG
jgi:hypothetical protein